MQGSDKKFSATILQGLFLFDFDLIFQYHNIELTSVETTNLRL